MRERASPLASSFPRPSSPRLRKGRSSEKPLPRGPGAKTGSYPNLFGYRAEAASSNFFLSPPPPSPPPRHHLLFSQAFPRQISNLRDLGTPNDFRVRRRRRVRRRIRRRGGVERRARSKKGQRSISILVAVKRSREEGGRG